MSVRPDLPDARRWGRACASMVLGLVLAAVVSLVIQWIANKGNAPWPSSVRKNYVGLTMAVVMLGCLGLLWWNRWTRTASWILLSAAVTLPLSLALMGSRYYLGGLAVDQNFRTAYLTRMTSSPALADFTYHGLAPYYPSGWFWLGGRFANLLGLPGWAAFKPWSILTLALITVIVYELWALVASKRLAFVLSLSTAIIGILQGAEEPYSWLATATIAPLSVLAWNWVFALARHRSAQVTGGLSTAIVLGIALGVFGDFYTLHMVFFAFTLIVLAVLGCWQSRRTAEDPIPLSSAIAALVRHGVLLAVVAVLVLLPVWWPYLSAILGGGHGSNIALRYLPPGGAEVPTLMLQFSLVGLACLLGLGWLVWRFRHSSVASALSVVTLSCYAWYLLSMLALVFGTTLLAFRIYNVLTVVLVCAGVFGAVALARFLGDRLSAHRTRIRLLAAVLGLGSLIGILQGVPAIASGDKQAFGNYYPDGATPVGRSDPADKDYWVPRLNTAVREMTGREPQQNILLANQPILITTSPYWSYQASSPQYADPLGRFGERNDQIRHWAQARDSAQLDSELRGNDKESPDVFVLERGAKGLTYSMKNDAFPANPNITVEKVDFDPKLFDSPAFHRRDVGPYAVITRNP
ncbi:arabinofuranosyltransferase [Sciscionella marina]|uniref:arabinofuranosyltransferase n=1 Tax=Sciscionella marina TaxID=508770 RepID=UPI0003A2E02E|nr:arabinofuranosyltransferase [Sciscionella marina]